MKKIVIIIALVIATFTTICADSINSYKGKDISAYLVGKYVDVKSAKIKLEEAGFEIVAIYSPVKKGTTIVFTNEVLKAEGAKPGRAHASVFRLFVDDKEKTISITNPVYFGKAYMQDQYNHTVFNAQLESINRVFPGLTGSIDKMKFDDLADYHFMVGMPYYNDVDELGVGTNEELLAKAKGYKKGKLLIFELKLSETSILLGYDLGRRTKKFVKKIGRANATVLPYAISIENGKATALAAKYYLAVSYPLLSFGKFTTIASIPGAIAKELAKPFK